jgi:hypothetical protein
MSQSNTRNQTETKNEKNFWFGAQADHLCQAFVQQLTTLEDWSKELIRMKAEVCPFLLVENRQMQYQNLM